MDINFWVRKGDGSKRTFGFFFCYFLVISLLVRQFLSNSSPNYLEIREIDQENQIAWNKSQTFATNMGTSNN